MEDRQQINPKLKSLSNQILAKKEQLQSLEFISNIADGAAQPLRLAIQKDMDHLMQLKQELHQIIGRIDEPTYQTVLTLRYFCGYSWEQVGKRMHYTARHVQRIHRQALAYLEDHGQDLDLFERARKAK